MVFRYGQINRKKILILLSLMDYSGAALGKQVGASRGAVHTWLTGQRSPKPVILRRIADLFGIEPDWLLEDYIQYGKNNKLQQLIDELLEYFEQHYKNYWVLERYIVNEIVQCIELDVGKSIFDNAPNTDSAIARMKEIREYVEETVAAAFRAQQQTGRPMDVSTAAKLTDDIIQETLKVFEEYVE